MNTSGQISPRELSTYIEFGFFCLYQNIADTDSASQFGSTGIEIKKELLSQKASIELKKELLSKGTPQNTKSCTKFAFNVFDSKLRSFFCTPAILLNLKFVSF